MNKFRKLFNEINIPIVNFELINNEPIIIYTNDAFANKFTTHNNKSKLKGKKLNNIIVPNNKIYESEYFDKRTKEGLDNKEIIERLTPNGVCRFAYCSISYDKNKSFAIYNDITEKIQKENHVKILNRILRHNLRNELTVISGLTDIIHKETNNSTIEDYTEKIQKSTSSLERLTEESKTLNKVLKDTNELKALNLKTQLNYAIDKCSSDFNISNINVNIDSNITVKSGDKLYIVLESLIDNALRYNNSSEPQVDIYVNDIDEKYIELCILDNGPGIPDTEINLINKNIEISDLNHSNGLGLWLTKWVIESYNGSVNINKYNCCGTNVKIKLLKY